jgi:hypothetical protein
MVSYYEMQFVTFLSILAGGFAIISWGLFSSYFIIITPFIIGWLIIKRDKENLKEKEGEKKHGQKD